MRWLAMIVLLFAIPASAARFTPPKLDGQVVDVSGKLSSIYFVDKTLRDIRERTGNTLVVLVVASLDGNAIEDIAYDTFAAWKPGDAGKDNGVLIVIAIADRKMRIETGRGVTGALTDLGADDIIAAVRPALAAGKYDDALIDAAKRISVVLQARSIQPLARKPAGTGRRTVIILAVVAGAIAVGIIVLLVLSPKARAIAGPLWFLLAGLGKLIGFVLKLRGGKPASYKGGGGSSGGGGASDSF